MTSNKSLIAHVAGFACFNVCTRTMHNALGYVMHSPSARALHNLERYCIILVHTLKHLKPAMWAITITYRKHTNSHLGGKDILFMEVISFQGYPD